MINVSVVMQRRVLLPLLCVFLTLPLVDALGVSPGKTIYEFQPDLQTQGTITIINSNQQDIRATIEISGELAPYVILQEKTMSLLPSEGEKQLQYELHLPLSFDSPGIHEALITIVETADAQGASDVDIAAAISVASKVQVRVPYPGKYAEAQLEIASSMEGAKFIILASNLGELPIQKAKAQIYVYDADNSLVGAVQTSQDSLEPKQRKEFIALWSANTSLGSYKATALFDYDGVIQTLSKEFTLGDFFIRALSLSVHEFKLGEVAKFDLLVENLANKPVPNLVAQISLFNEQDIPIATIQSTPELVESRLQKQIFLYWPTEGLTPGSYHGKLLLRYADKSSTKEVYMKVSKNRIDISLEGTGNVVAQVEQPKGQGVDIVNALLIIIVLLAIAVVSLIFLYLRRK